MNPGLGSHNFSIFGTWGPTEALLKSKQFVNPFLDVWNGYLPSARLVFAVCATVAMVEAQRDDDFSVDVSINLYI